MPDDPLAAASDEPAGLGAGVVVRAGALLREARAGQQAVSQVLPRYGNVMEPRDARGERDG